MSDLVITGVTYEQLRVATLITTHITNISEVSYESAVLVDISLSLCLDSGPLYDYKLFIL